MRACVMSCQILVKEAVFKGNEWRLWVNAEFPFKIRREKDEDNCASFSSEQAPELH